MQKGVATTHIVQIFHNPNRAQLEGTYIFPLPPEATIGEFKMSMNGKMVSAEVIESEKARNIYESIVRRRKDPGLLEYVGQKMIRARVFPIPARGDVTIEIRYEQILNSEGGVTEYVYPLNSSRFSKKPLQEVVISVDLASDIPLKAIYSPTHPVDVVRKGDRAARVVYEGKNVVPGRDFVLYSSQSRKDLGLSLLTHREEGEDGFFLLFVTPKEEYNENEIQPKAIQFVVDTSGSMTGQKMEQARRALIHCLKHLNPRDHFNVIAFSTEARPLAPKFLSATEQNVTQAVRFVEALEARGGTAIDEALTQALTATPPEGILPMVIFLTDGKPTIGERNPTQILANVTKKNVARSRIFVFGVGSNLDTHLLDKIAEANQGTREYVTEGEDIAVKVKRFYDKASSPVLANLDLKIDGVEVLDVYPKKLPDLFRGTQLVVLGRYDGKGDVAVHLRGKIGVEQREFVHEATFPTSDSSAEFLPRLWAHRKVAYLVDEIRLHGHSKELKAEIVRLGKRYGLVTPFTSALILEEEMAGTPITRRRNRRGHGFAPAWHHQFNRHFSYGVYRAEGVNPAKSVIEKLGRQDREFERKARFMHDNLKQTGGKKAVELSQKLEKDKQANSLAQNDESAENETERAIRRVGSKTFYQIDGTWIDSTYDHEKDKAKVIEIEYLSKAYFELTARSKPIARCLSLGERVIVKVGEKVFRISQAAEKGE
jgi:Ca-activated chloride channel family protein